MFNKYDYLSAAGIACIFIVIAYCAVNITKYVIK